MAKVLVVEDDLQLCEDLGRTLTSEGLTTEIMRTAEDALQLLGSFEYDLIILDWDLPGMSGLELCKRFRKDGGATSILFLTGHSDVQDKEAGFDSGGDDYLTKPFSSRELLARVKGLLRRRRALASSQLKIGNVEIIPDRRALIIQEKEYYLSPKESALLEFLMRNSNKSFSAEALLRAVWPADSDGSVGSVRSWMRILRQKFEGAGQPDFIKTLHRSGYIIESIEP